MQATGWTFYAIEANAAQLHAIDALLTHQLGQKYSWCAVYWNFLLCRCCCCAMKGSAAAEFRPRSIDPFLPARRRPRKRTWFCSELVSAALIYGGVLDADTLEPYLATPGKLRSLADALDWKLLMYDAVVIRRGDAAFSVMIRDVKEQKTREEESC